jgi:hypothetical protein
LGSGQAHAEAPPSRNAPPDEVVAKQRATTKTFYGWQILVTGEVGSVVAAASVFLPERPLGSFASSLGFVAGMPVYALGGPIVHWNHGDFTKGLISFGGNAAFALTGGLVGQTIRCNKENDAGPCGERGFFTGLGVALLIAPVLDAALLGWEDVPVDYIGWRDRSGRSGVVLSPSWNVGPRGSFELGISGRF